MPKNTKFDFLSPQFPIYGGKNSINLTFYHTIYCGGMSKIPGVIQTTTPICCGYAKFDFLAYIPTTYWGCCLYTRN
jgi:hypothetical protein